MFYFGTPFGGNIFKGRWTNYGEADEEHIRLRIGQGSETIVVLLTRGIPQPQGYGHSVTDHRGRVVVETEMFFCVIAKYFLEIFLLTQWAHIRRGNYRWCRISTYRSCPLYRHLPPRI